MKAPRTRAGIAGVFHPPSWPGPRPDPERDAEHATVERLIQTTALVPARDRWNFWKGTVLQSVECRRPNGDAPFAACRSLTALSAGIVTDNVSSAIEVHRSTAQTVRDGVDYATLSMFIEGHGVADPRNTGGRALATGEVAFCDLTRSFRMSGLTTFRELRLYMPRATFAARVGPIEDLIDLQIPADAPLAALFVRYFRGLSDATPTLSRRDADAGLDGVLHLLSGLVASRTGRRGDEGERLSRGGLLGLADRHIAALLNDPTLDPAKLARAIGVSRSRLYRIYAECGGVAAAIRDARLDHARMRLAAPADRHRNVEQIGALCGFRDHATFSRAFRRRFGVAPRDCRGR